jgi:uncharacterized protein
MTGFLLDINVLLALSWPTHGAHHKVLQWFTLKAKQGWVTCPFTQAGFIRVISNPAFSRDALTLPEATQLLKNNTAHRYHRFWADDLAFGEAVRGFDDRLIGHQQVTDSYLLGLALHKKGTFVTLDRSVLSLLPEDSPHRDQIFVIS